MDPRLQLYALNTGAQCVFRPFRFLSPPGSYLEQQSGALQERFDSILIRTPYVHAPEPTPPRGSLLCSQYREITDGCEVRAARVSESQSLLLINSCSTEALSALRSGLEPVRIRHRLLDGEASKTKFAKWIVRGGPTGSTDIENTVPVGIHLRVNEWRGFEALSRALEREDLGSGHRSTNRIELGTSEVRRITVRAGIVKRGALCDCITRGGAERGQRAKALRTCGDPILFEEIPIAQFPSRGESDGQGGCAFNEALNDWKAKVFIDERDDGAAGEAQNRVTLDAVSGDRGVGGMGHKIWEPPKMTSLDVRRHLKRSRSTLPYLINPGNRDVRGGAKEAPVVYEALNAPETAVDLVLSTVLRDLESIFEGEGLPEWPDRRDPKASPFLQIFAADAVPDCDFRRLPVVVLTEDNASEHLEAESKLESWREGLELCAVKSLSVCHLELYLDWGLSNPVAAATKAGSDELLREWKPKRRPFLRPKSSVNTRKDGLSLAIRLDCKAECMQEFTSSNRKGQTGPSKLNRASKKIGSRESTKTDPFRSSIKKVKAIAFPETSNPDGGVKIKRKHLQDDFSFFLEMHSPECTLAADGTGSSMDAEPNCCKPVAHPRLSNLQEINAEPAVCVQHVSLPPSMASLLAHLETEHDAVVLSCKALPEGVTHSGLMDVDAMTAALHRLAEIKGCKESPPLEVFQTCSLLVILRQTAVLVLHFGPRVGYLHMKQSINNLAALRGRLCDISKSLAEAYFDVERGRASDHPKLDALKELLTGCPNGKGILVLCDPCAFFTLYPIISKCGLKPYQLDRDGSMHTLPQERVKSQVCEAVEKGKCILATHRHMCLPGFPLEEINHVIEYSQMPLGGTSTPADQRKGAKQWTSLQSVNPLPSTLLPPEMLDSKGDGQNVREVTGAAMECTQQNEQVNLVEAKVAINSRVSSVINTRQSLFQAIVRLETQGMAIVSRDLGVVDIAFPPNVAVCIWPIASEMYPKGPVDPTIEGVVDKLHSVLLAYSSMLICIEGKGPTVSAVMARLAPLQAEFSLKEIHINIFCTESPKQTQDFAVDTLSTLQKHTAVDVLSKFDLSDVPSVAEKFLGRLPFLNPFAVHAIAALRPALRDTIGAIVEDWNKVSKLLPDVPPTALEACSILFAEGRPIIGDGHALENEQEKRDPTAPGEALSQADLHPKEHIQDELHWRDMQYIDLNQTATVPSIPGTCRMDDPAKWNGDKQELDQGSSLPKIQHQMEACDEAEPIWEHKPVECAESQGCDDFVAFNVFLEKNLLREPDPEWWQGMDAAPDHSALDSVDVLLGLDRGLNQSSGNCLPECRNFVEFDVDGNSAAIVDGFYSGFSSTLRHSQPDNDAFSIARMASIPQYQERRWPSFGSEQMLDNASGGLGELHVGDQDFFRGVQGSIDLRTASWEDVTRKETGAEHSAQNDHLCGQCEAEGRVDSSGQQGAVGGRAEKGNRHWDSRGHWVQSNFLRFKR